MRFNSKLTRAATAVALSIGLAGGAIAAETTAASIRGIVTLSLDHRF